MSYFLFLDDVRGEGSSEFKTFAYEKFLLDLDHEPMVVARCYEEFVDVVREMGCPHYVTFDHDLGDEKTGMDCAKWLTEWILDDPTRMHEDFHSYSHSANPAGRDNIYGLMASLKRHMNDHTS
jgi:hypothetical protein